MRNVVITGSSGGIGTALVEAFRAAGDRVLAVDHARPQHDDGWFDCDLARLAREATYRDAFLERLRDALGGTCHVLINNAAVQKIGSFLELRAGDWDETLALNLLAPVYLTQALVPLMPPGEGTVINVSSIHARQTKPGFSAYSTSKAALSGMTRALAVELGAHARFVSIEPAAIGTQMLRDGFAGNAEGLAQLSKAHPAGRIGEPEEVARLAYLLCDRGIGFVNGAAIGIDGAISARLHDPA